MQATRERQMPTKKTSSRQYIDGPSRPFSAIWGVTAPWAHPLWHEYLLELVDLTTPTSKPPVLHMVGATHEFILTAITRETQFNHGLPLSMQAVGKLTPPNYGYQFIAKDNLAALNRIQDLVDRIDARTISPDTDYRHEWDTILFPDAFAMVSVKKKGWIH